ncbi:MAG: DUF2461 domain-containing protein [Bacteroidota bacterium]
MVSINKSTLEFLSDLNRHNDREWFQKNRSRYLEARSTYESFIQAVIMKITEFDPILKGLEASSCMYRINRDIRFSNDKTLYKTHLGAFIVRGGKQNGDRYAGYYIHIEPGNNSMIAGGAYMPPSAWLKMIREKIDEQGARFLKLIHNKEFVNFFGELEGEKLKTAPKGFPKDHPMMELLKMKSYLVTKMIPDKEVTGNTLFELVIRGSKIMKPLNDFLNEY